MKKEVNANCVDHIWNCRKSLARGAGAFDAIVCRHWARGGEGAVELGNAVEAACSQPSDFKFLYDLGLSIKEKIETIAKEIYGADGVEYRCGHQHQSFLFALSFFCLAWRANLV